MTRNSSVAGGLEGDLGSPDAVFRLAVVAYAGVVLAGLASVTAAAVDGWPTGLAETYVAGFVAGAVGGALLAWLDPRLPARLGRSLGHRLAVMSPAVLFTVLWVVPLEASPGTVALASVIGVVATGYPLSQLASNRYVDAMTPGEPVETWRWTPPGSPLLDLTIGGMWGLIALGNAVVGDWLEALLWLAVGTGWIASCLAEGRWSFGPGRDRCGVELYDTGLVKRRPYMKTFVSWEAVDHVRLREGELIVDYGFRDVRFDAADLEDPEALREAIERRIF